MTDLRTGRIDWAAAGTWAYLAIFALIAATGALLCLAARSRERPAGPLAAAGLIVPPRALALVLGIAFVAAGVAGFLPVFMAAPPAEAPHLQPACRLRQPHRTLPVNAVGSALHLGLGLLGIGAFLRPAWARPYFRGFAAVLGILTVMGLLPALDTAFGLAPLFSHCVWLHGIEAVAAGYVGFVMPEPTPIASLVRTRRAEYASRLGKNRRYATLLPWGWANGMSRRIGAMPDVSQTAMSRTALSSKFGPCGRRLAK